MPLTDQDYEAIVAQLKRQKPLTGAGVAILKEYAASPNNSLLSIVLTCEPGEVLKYVGLEGIQGYEWAGAVIKYRLEQGV